MLGRLPVPSSIHSFSYRRKRTNQEKGGRPKLPFLWECLSLLNGRNSLRSNKTPIFNAMPPILIVRQAAQPVIPVTGRLGSKCKQLRIRVCWENYVLFNPLLICSSDISVCFISYYCAWWSDTTYCLSVDEPIFAICFSCQMLLSR